MRDGKRVTVYLDGKVEIVGEVEEKVRASENQFFLGGRSDNVANWEGRLDEVAVFDRVLTADEIARHCAGPAAAEGER